jgi:hypothetical protein
MNKLKTVAIVVLLGVNLALLGAVVNANLSEAQAAPYPTSNYIVVTGKTQENKDSLYILDLASQRFAAWKYDLSKKKMQPIGGQRLDRDFKITN